MDFKKFYKNHSDAQDDLNSNFDLINKKVEEDTGWIKASTVGTSAIFYRRIGNMVYMNGQGDKTLPKASETLLWAIPLGFRPNFPAAKAEVFYELANTDSTPTNVTIVRVRSDAMNMIYRNNDMGCAFDGVCWPTSDSFPA